jgi:hypothetical protein
MRQHHSLQQWRRAAAIGALSLLLLTAGFCCFEQHGMNGHRVSMDVCFLTIVIMAVISLSVGALVFSGLAPIPGPAAAAIPRRVAGQVHASPRHPRKSSPQPASFLVEEE